MGVEGEIPNYIVVKAKPKADEIREMLVEFRERDVSKDAVELFLSLALMEPHERVEHNMQIMVSLLSKGPVTTILNDGITPYEQQSLLELDRRGVSAKAREVAHALLNVKERWIMYKTMSGVFRRFRNMEDACLRVK